jgi:pilus assembly protein Flp/PilA
MNINGIDLLSQKDSTMSLWQALYQVFQDESGATAIEYGLIATLISLAIVSAAQLTGTNLIGTFTTVANNL